MTKKNDAKFEEELICHLKIDMNNMTNFDSSTRKSKKFALQFVPLTQLFVTSLHSTEKLCLMALKIDAKFEGKLTCALKNDMKNLENLH